MTEPAPASAAGSSVGPRHRGPRRSRWHDEDGRLRFGLLALLVIGGALAAAYWPLLLGRVPLPIDIIFASPVFDGIREQFEISHNHAELGDLVAGFYPIHDYVGDALKSGDVPLWNPHVLMGSPLFAAYQPGMLYPPNLLMYGLLPTAAAWGLLFPLRLLIAGVGMALFVRSLDATRAGALVSGLAYAFCGYLLTWSGWPHVAVAAGLPWVLLALHRLRQSPTPARAGLLALAVAFPLLGGHPQTMVYVAGTAVVYALLLLTASGRRLAFLGWAALAGLLGLGVAAAQLLPTAEWLGLISRDLSARLAGHLPSWNALGLLSRDTRSSPNSILMNIPEAATYVGALTLVAAALAVFSRRRREVVVFGLLGAGALGTAYGIAPVYDVVARLPVLSGLPAARTLVVAQVALCVLAGLGISAWQQRLAHAERRTVILWWLVLVDLGALLAYGVVRLADRTTTVPPNGIRTVDYEVGWFRGPVAIALLLVVVLVALSPLMRRVLRRPATGGLLASALVLLLAADLVTYGYGHVPFAPRTAAYPEPPVLAQLDERDPDVYRIASLASVYAKNLEMAYDEDAPGGTGYNVEAVAPLLQPFGGGFFGFLLDPAKVASVDDRRLDLYGVRYLVASPYNKGDLPLRARPDRFEVVSESAGVVVFRNRAALPRAFVVAEAGVEETSTESAYCALAQIEPTRTVLVSPPDGGVPEACDQPFRLDRPRSPDPRATAAVSDVRRAVDVVEVDLDDPAEGVLVLADVFYPGWRVTVDGEEREVLRTNGGFKGVRVGPGDERVVFSYDPASWRTGRIVSVVSLLAVAALLLSRPLLRRRRRA